MNWQPIETAPKDGTEILIVTGSLIEKAKWSNEAVFIEETRPGWEIFECDDSYYSYSWEESKPTHWMPLPKPPTT